MLEKYLLWWIICQEVVLSADAIAMHVYNKQEVRNWQTLRSLESWSWSDKLKS